jgi:hypothetical protein
MAPSRTRNTDSDGPSTADVSANEDVEMQESNGRINGFSKFSVSAHHLAVLSWRAWRSALKKAPPETST